MQHSNVKRPAAQLSDEQLLEELRTAARKYGGESLTMDRFIRFEQRSGSLGLNPGIFKSRFGSWNKALEEAGLTPKKRMNIPEEELMEEIGRVWTQFGHQPTPKEFRTRSSMFNVLKQRYHGYYNALEAYVSRGNAMSTNVAVGEVNTIHTAENNSLSVLKAFLLLPAAWQHVLPDLPLFCSSRLAFEEGLFYLTRVLFSRYKDDFGKAPRPLPTLQLICHRLSAGLNVQFETEMLPSVLSTLNDLRNSAVPIE